MTLNDAKPRFQDLSVSGHYLMLNVSETAELQTQFQWNTNRSLMPYSRVSFRMTLGDSPASCSFSVTAERDVYIYSSRLVVVVVVEAVIAVVDCCEWQTIWSYQYWRETL